jgi:phospholipid/cholesterol/gamma-HCH transport system substrate-binding protein
MKGYREAVVGVFVLIGLLCVAYLTIKLGRMEVLSDAGYRVVARFSSVSGLRVGAEVEIAGVPVGKVASIELS